MGKIFFKGNTKERRRKREREKQRSRREGEDRLGNEKREKKREREIRRGGQPRNEKLVQGMMKGFLHTIVHVRKNSYIIISRKSFVFNLHY